MLQPDRFQTTRAIDDATALVDYTNCECHDSRNSDPYCSHDCGDSTCPVMGHRMFLHPSTGLEISSRALGQFREITNSVCATNWNGQVAA